MAEYKGRPEQLHRLTATDEVKGQREQYLTDVWNHVVRRIAVDRKRVPTVVARWINTAPHQPDKARTLGMVDGIVEFVLRRIQPRAKPTQKIASTTCQ